jgi:hypothetical protein
LVLLFGGLAVLKSVAGRKVPFTLRQFPIRLSRRVGLRTMPSIGAKRLVCPSGEQITNGGFETGDLTGWTATGNITVWSNYAQEGTYQAGIYNAAYGLTGTLEQDFANPIPYECFVDASVFKIYISAGFLISPPIGGKVTIRIKYTDDTATVINWQRTADNPGWNEIDLKSYLELGKTVKGIKLDLNAQDPRIGVDVDGCTCNV